MQFLACLLALGMLPGLGHEGLVAKSRFQKVSGLHCVKAAFSTVVITTFLVHAIEFCFPKMNIKLVMMIDF